MMILLHLASYRPVVKKAMGRPDISNQVGQLSSKISIDLPWHMSRSTMMDHTIPKVPQKDIGHTNIQPVHTDDHRPQTVRFVGDTQHHLVARAQFHEDKTGMMVWNPGYAE